MFDVISELKHLTLSQTTKVRLKKSAEDNFKFDEIGRKFSKWIGNTAGKGEIACYEQFLLFPQCFQKTFAANKKKKKKNRPCLGKG